jgi:benzoyl-CoA 2,3-dioxygenase component B
MLTEEAHHMFVGETGVGRVIQRTAEVMNKVGPDVAKVRAEGAIDLGIIQRYLNHWYSSSLDLFGGERSSNASDFFAAGVKGRYREEEYKDHLAIEGAYDLPILGTDGKMSVEKVPLRNAMNEVLRDAYVDDCQRGVDRWNKRLEEAGLGERLRLPSKRFYRHIGLYADLPFDLDGRLVSRSDWDARKAGWLPSAEDRAFVTTLMQPVREPGKIANWLARPARGIRGLPFEYEYVRLD